MQRVAPSTTTKTPKKRARAGGVGGKYRSSRVVSLSLSPSLSFYSGSGRAPTRQTLVKICILGKDNAGEINQTHERARYIYRERERCMENHGVFSMASDGDDDGCSFIVFNVLAPACSRDYRPDKVFIL